jgi:hypothetical protein
LHLRVLTFYCDSLDTIVVGRPTTCRRRPPIWPRQSLAGVQRLPCAMCSPVYPLHSECAGKQFLGSTTSSGNPTCLVTGAGKCVQSCGSWYYASLDKCMHHQRAWKWVRDTNRLGLSHNRREEIQWNEEMGMDAKLKGPNRYLLRKAVGNQSRGRDNIRKYAGTG